MSKKRILCIVITFAILGIGQFSVFAQNSCSILFKGQVFEQESHLPVAFATLYLLDLKIGVQSDERGQFEIELPCNKELLIQISQLDYIKDTFSINSGESGFSKGFYLKPKDRELSTIIVHAHEAELMLKSNITNTLTARDMRELAGKTLSETIGGVVGVYNIKTGPGINKPMIHGLYGSRIQLVNNEIAQMGQQWGADHAPEIDPFLASNITIIKGAGAVKYGPRAIGGVILINPEPLAYDSAIHGVANLVGISNGKGGAASLSLTGSFKSENKKNNLNWRLQSSVKKLGDQQTPDYNLTNTGLEEFNYSLTANFINEEYQLDAFYSSFQTEIGILRGAHVGNEDDLFAAINQRPPFYTQNFTYTIQSPRQFVKHRLLKSKLHFDWEEVGEVNILYGYQQNNRQEYDIRRSSTDNRPNIDLKLSSHIFKSQLTHKELFGLFAGETGIDFEYQNNKSIPGTGSIPLIPNYESIQTGVFVSENYKRQSFTYELGLRYDYQRLSVLRFNDQNELENPTYNFNLYSLILGANYQVNSQIHLKANLSRSERPPNVNELFSQGLHHSLASIELGDPSLEKETNNKFIVSGEYSKNERFQLSADLHISLYEGYIYLLPNGTQQTIRGAFPVFEYLQTDALLKGIDLGFSYEFFHHLVNKTQLSMVRGQDFESKTDLIFMPADRIRNSTNWRLDNIGLFKEVNFKGSINKVFKQQNAPLTERFPFPNRGEVTVPDGYLTLDFMASATKKLKDTQLSVGFSVYNLLNQSYTDYLNRLRYYADEVGRNFEIKINYIF